MIFGNCLQKPATSAEERVSKDWMAWAKRTIGFSGADLAGLINEALDMAVTA